VSKPLQTRRAWFQFRLRTFLIIVAIAGLGLGWLGRGVHRAQMQRAAVVRIQELGGSVQYLGADPFSEPDSRVEGWVRWTFGNDYYDRVTAVDLNSKAVTDADMPLFDYLPDVEDVDLAGTKVGDRGIRHLRGHSQLRKLNLFESQVGDEGWAILKDIRTLKHVAAGRTKITDAGLVHAGVLTQLEYLGLRGNRVTDSGLVHLRGLTNLEGIYLGETQVTDAGLVHLQPMTKMKYPRLDHLAITDEGLRQLTSLKELETLPLSGTQITDAGLVHLLQLPKLKRLQLDDTAISDAGVPILEQLSLEALDVRDTRITAEGAHRIAHALPNCTVDSGTSAAPESAPGGLLFHRVGEAVEMSVPPQENLPAGDGR
jgi:Leucine Rich repeat